MQNGGARSKIFTNLVFAGIIVISIALLYQQIIGYDFPLSITIVGYRIDTYLGVVLLAILLSIAPFILINNLFVIAANKLESYKANKLLQSQENAQRQLIESSILIGWDNVTNVKDILDNIQTEYLFPSQLQYYNLLKAKVTYGSLPVQLCYELAKQPHMKSAAAKKLANVELRLGNLKKAKEWASIYSAVNATDSDNTKTLCEIALKEGEFATLTKLISQYIKYSTNSTEDMSDFANMYFAAAKECLAQLKQDEALDLCEKVLLIDPINYNAAELFCEIAASKKQDQLILTILINCFRQKPDFRVFLLLRKFTRHFDQELYDLLFNAVDLSEHPEMLLSIGAVLGVDKDVKELLNKL